MMSIIPRRQCVLHSMRRWYATALSTDQVVGKKNAGGGGGVKVGNRFWKNANVKSNQDGKRLTVSLDSRPIKTPNGNKLELPANKSILAQLVAQEWNVLTSLKLKPHSLPLTSLAARAIDLCHEKDDTTSRLQIYNLVLPYLDTDTLLIFSPHSEHSGNLRKSQESLYRPVISWAEDELQKFSSSPEKPITITWADHDLGFVGNKQPTQTVEAARNWLNSLDSFELTGFERIVLASKSFLVGFWVIQQSRSKSNHDDDTSFPLNKLVQDKDSLADEIATLVNLELDFQTREWGQVEDTHDVDWADIRRQLSSACIVLMNKR